MKLGTIAYLPPFGARTKAFVDNLESFKHTHPLHFYSDSGHPASRYSIPSPEVVLSGRGAPLSINNYVWVRGIHLAIQSGLDYFIYLEEDSRVGCDHWDYIMFEEFFKCHGALMGGTPSVWNMGLCGYRAALAAEKYVHHVTLYTGRPPLLWQRGGFKGENQGIWCYPNGSCAIYHTATVASIFSGSKHDIGTFCSTLGAWDVANGITLWQRFGQEVFSKVAPLKCVYSGYKDYHYSTADRKRMLTSGEVVAVHQIKGTWIPERKE